jgi:hypothetical protein
MNRFQTISFFLLMFVFYNINLLSQPVTFLPKDNLYPRWLNNEYYRTDQTSGIVFLGVNEKKEKVFLLADDAGVIHRLNISKDTIFTFTTVLFSADALNFLQKFPKWDFEDITFDKTTKSVYTTITGNGSDYKDLVGVYKLTFNQGLLNSDTITTVSKVNIQPVGTIWKYIADDIGFSGLAVDSHFFYLGLEGIKTEESFADSTLIFVVDKKNYRIIKSLSTKELGIHTICGLYSDKDSSLWGVDRESKKVFHIRIGKNFETYVEKFYTFISRIPGYHDYSYYSAIESITFDNEKYMYLTDKPFRKSFVPSSEILINLDNETVKNFKEHIPIIYRYRVSY